MREILDTPDDGHVGFIVEVDKFPVEPHDKFTEYTPTLEYIAPDADWFSEFQRGLAKQSTT